MAVSIYVAVMCKNVMLHILLLEHPDAQYVTDFCTWCSRAVDAADVTIHSQSTNAFPVFILCLKYNALIP